MSSINLDYRNCRQVQPSDRSPIFKRKTDSGGITFVELSDWHGVEAGLLCCCKGTQAGHLHGMVSSTSYHKSSCLSFAASLYRKDCAAQVLNFYGAKYRKFLNAADAELWISENSGPAMTRTSSAAAAPAARTANTARTDVPTEVPPVLPPAAKAGPVLKPENDTVRLLLPILRPPHLRSRVWARLLPR